MPSNQAAWQKAKATRPMTVGEAPYTPPGPNQMVVKNGAVAMNPIDGIKQAIGDKVFPWIKYPFIMGADLAGEVVEVGPGVTRFRVGDRVMAHALGMEEFVNKPSEQAFQHYTVVRTSKAAHIPRNLTFEEACVLPVCLSTAAFALFQPDFLALPYPSSNPKPLGKTVLVWGGSSSVGSNAIQLAKAAGCDVITTASPKNFNYVRKLGATAVFDYRSETVIADIMEALKKKECAGAIAIGNGSLDACVTILASTKGNKFVAQVSVDLPDEMPTNVIGWIGLGMSMAVCSTMTSVKAMIKGVKTAHFSAGNVSAEVSKAIYEDFVGKALAEDRYIAAPEPMVVGKGLEFIQEAMDMSLKGVSAKKVVVSL